MARRKAAQRDDQSEHLSEEEDFSDESLPDEDANGSKSNSRSRSRSRSRKIKELVESVKKLPPADNWTGRAAIYFYLTVIFGIGLPTWWTLTSPARAPLPDVSNLMVHWQTTVHQLQVTVVMLDLDPGSDSENVTTPTNVAGKSGVDDFDQSVQFANTLRAGLIANHATKFTPDGLYHFQVSWKVRRPLEIESKLISSSKDLYSLETALRENVAALSSRGSFKIYLLPTSYSSKLGLDKMAGPVGYTMGTSRLAFLRREFAADSDANYEIIQDRIMEIFDLITTSGPKLDSAPLKLLIQRDLDVLVNVMSESENLHVIEPLVEDKISEIHSLANTVFTPSSGISDVVNVKFITQRIHYAVDKRFMSLNLLHPERDRQNSAEKPQRLFSTRSVPSILNRFETRVVEHNKKNIYQMIVLISDPGSDPILFYDPASGTKSTGIQVADNRGGVILWNGPLDYNLAFKSFVRSLLGLKSETLPASVLGDQSSKATPAKTIFTEWELDCVTRSVVAQQLASTLQSLESIQKLVGKISNIVILPEVSARMHRAVSEAHSAISSLAAGRLGVASRHSSLAFQESDSAFFHPSLLELLYFPQDQKYAVYFPLFLPISLPVGTSLLYLVRHFRSRLSGYIPGVGGKSKKD